GPRGSCLRRDRTDYRAARRHGQEPVAPRAGGAAPSDRARKRMEADSVKLSDDEVRARFSSYHDGELPEPEAVTVRKRLAENPQLADEYKAFTQMLAGLAELGNDLPADAKPGVPTIEKVDLLANIQKRIHKRSGGKFYKSRFARAAGVF